MSTAPNPAMEAMHARAFQTILLLAGYVEDGSNETVRLSQDDATRDWTVRVGKRSWHDRSLLYALAAAYDEMRASEAASAQAAEIGG